MPMAILSNMELKRAIEILTEYNKWRLGADAPMLEPSLITVALNKIIDNYNQTKKPSK
jgi:hypothetical protein